MNSYRLERILANKKWNDEHNRTRRTTVQGKPYEVWSDFIERCTFAMNDEGEIKAISSSGYITNDLTVRKAIAIRFGHNSFRK